MVPLALIEIFSQIHMPRSREAGLEALAEYAGATKAYLFGKDEEIGVFLPAQGLPQTLRYGARWQAFLHECLQRQFHRDLLPGPPDGALCQAVGMIDKQCSAILVLVGKEPGASMRKHICALLQLLGAKLTIERAAQSAAGHAAAAQDANRHTAALNVALDANRRELQKAFERAEQELVSRREVEKKLKEADLKKDEFLAMLAHELRNPLAPIYMAAQIIKTGSQDQERLVQASKIIDRQIKHMTSLLDDLLDVSRVTHGKIELDRDRIDVADIVGEAVEQSRPLFESKSHDLAIDLPREPAHLIGDHTRLVQVLTNLLNNAAKYTPNHGKIELRATLSACHVVFTLRDNGIGMDQQLLPHVFEPFTQAQRSSDRAQGGLGIGLALVKNVVELHGGSVYAYSAGNGHGSEFVVHLPRVIESDTYSSEGFEGASTSAETCGQGLSIMIVDDNADAADTLATFLETLGHKVAVAYGAREALALVAKMRPKVLLLDIGLPDMDGYELGRRIKSSTVAAGSILIALTGYGQENDRARSMQAGFDYHLTKPADPHKIKHLLTTFARHE